MKEMIATSSHRSRSPETQIPSSPFCFVPYTLYARLFDMNRPIGQILRKRARSDAAQPSILGESKLLTIEEQIAKLEQEIASGSDESDDDSSSSSESSDDNSEQSQSLPMQGETAILSSLRPEDRIAPLPAKLLPAAVCKFADKAKAKPKRPRYADILTESSIASGLEKTIAEQLRHYEPASWDKKPFFCRICKYQGSSVEELEQHKQTESHRKAVELERKLSSCSLCRKQFTSPDQLKGHLEGKAHKEKLERAKAFQKNKMFH